jgi:Rrf2 family protein
MLSQTTEYALRAAVFLARGDGSPQTSQSIAAGTRVPGHYLSKILHGLSRAGVVASQRGPHGGFTLVRPAAELTLLDVVNGVEPIRRLRGCPLGLTEHGVNLCPLHRRLDSAIAQVEEILGSTTLAAVLDRPGESVPLGAVARRCPFPLPAPAAAT